jgi:hypothetical protein
VLTNTKQFNDKGLVRSSRGNPGSVVLRRHQNSRSRSSKFTQLLAYLTALYADGEISKNDFKIMINYVCTAFVEQEIENKVERLVVERLQSLLN